MSLESVVEASSVHLTSEQKPHPIPLLDNVFSHSCAEEAEAMQGRSVRCS